MIAKQKWVRRVCGLLLAGAVPVGLFFALLGDREYAVPDWLRHRVELRVNQMVGQGTVLIGDMHIRVGYDLHPHLMMTDVQLIDADARHIARISQAGGVVSPRGIAFQRAVLMQNIQITGARIEVLRQHNGAVTVSFGTAAVQDDQIDSFAAVLDQVDKTFSANGLEALETVRIDGVIVQYTDQRANKSWTVDSGQVVLDLTGTKTQLHGDFSLLTGRDTFTRLTFSLDRDDQDSPVRIAADISDVNSRDLASQLPALGWLSVVDATMSTNLRSSLNGAGQWGELFATLEIAKGAVTPDASVAPVRFNSVKAYVQYDPGQQVVSFDEFHIDAPAMQASLTGQMFLRDFTDGMPNAFVTQLAMEDTTIAPSRFYPKGINLDRMQSDLRFRLNPFEINLGQALIETAGAKLLLSGDYHFGDDGWQSAFHLDLPNMGVDDLRSFWPETVKPKSRDWMMANLKSGQINHVWATGRLQQTQPARIAAGGEFERTQVKFMAHMPDITQADGTVILQDNQMFVGLDRGTIIAPQGGAISLAGSQFTVLDMTKQGGDGLTTLKAEGPLPAVLSILDQKPLHLLEKSNRTYDVAQGRAEIDGQITAPLRRGVTPAEVRYDITAKLSNIRSRNIVPGRELTARQVDAVFDNTGMTISGPMTVSGVPAHVNWHKKNGAAHLGQSRLDADVPLSADALAAFGVALPSGTIAGNGRAKLHVDFQAGHPPAFDLSSDLRGLRVRIPAVNWNKAPSNPARASIAGRLGVVPEIDRFEVSGAGLRAAGDMVLRAGGGVERMHIADLRVDNWLNTSATLSGGGRGKPMAVALSGGHLDLRQAKLGSATGDGGPLNINLDRLLIADGIALTDVNATLANDNGIRGKFTGRVNGGPPVRGVITPKAGVTAIHLTGDDGGAVAQAAGLLKNASGGAFDLLLETTATKGEFRGDLQMQNLRLRDAPALAALLDAISVVGLLRQLDGQGLAFDEVEATFKLTPDQVLISKSSAVGPGLGVSLDGIYGLKSKNISFQGVVSPFYLVNGIGALFTRKGEGLIGINFNVDGTVDTPQVTVNPLSAFTPGMFREIFRRAPPEIGQ